MTEIIFEQRWAKHLCSMKMNRKNYLLSLFRTGVFFVLLLLSLASTAQTEKIIRHQDQLWLSLNNTIKFTPKWALIADLHMRRNNFAADPSFYFVRGGIDYFFTKQFSGVLGYGHMWVANAIKDTFIYTNENRIYQQLQFTEKVNKTGLLFRVRNEQRWQEKLVSGQKSGDLRFTNRVRFLASVNFQLFKNPNLPRPMIANELCVQFGKDVIYNTFDQNRLTLGIQQRISKDLSFDLGYMLVYQQRITGNFYDLNNTLRLFFYYTPDLTKAFKPANHHPHLSGEE
jgi:hypothetical protein